MNALVESINDCGARFAGFALPMLLQSAVLIAVLFALDLALRKRVRATVRYAVWMLTLVKLALPPSLASPTGAAYWLPLKTAAATAPAEIFVNTIHSAGGAIQTLAPPTLTGQAVLFLAWLAVALGIGIWMAWRLRMVVGVVRQSVEAPESVRTVLESCRRQLGIAWIIPVRCAAIGSPAICGILRPIILIPPTLVEKLSEAEMRPVLLHELAHYKRGDLWVNHAQIFLQIVYWYNPLLWLANARIRRAREQAVDEMVLVEMGGEAQAYPATLLHVAKLSLGRPMAALGLMGILEPGRGLTQRILHIMNRPLPRTARIGARGLAAVLLLALIALPMACRRPAEAAPQTTVSDPAQRKAIAIESNDLRPLVTDLVDLQHSNPTNIIAEVLPTLSPRSALIPDLRTRKLIIRTTEKEMPAAKALIAKLDAAITTDSPSALEPLISRVFKLKHSDATDLSAKLKLMLSPRSVIFANTRLNQLFIKTTAKEMAEMETLIAKLDSDTTKDLIAPGPQ